MKKILFFILTLMLLFQAIFVNAAYGDIEGYTKYTDIVAYINHYAIESYNINGYTVIIAEDLGNFGFIVKWDEATRSLHITRNYATNEINQFSVPYETPAYNVGKDALPVLSTDISAYVNGVKTTSYNIGGKTVIDFNSLSAFGKVSWHEDLRVIKLWVEDGLEMRNTMQPLKSLPKTTLYSPDGRTISVYDHEVDAYIKVGWYKNKSDAQDVANAEKNKAAVRNLRVGQNVMFTAFPLNKYGVIKAINSSTGKVQVYVNKIINHNGQVMQDMAATWFYGLYDTQWVDANIIRVLG